MMIAFASIDPHQDGFGAREARRLVEEHAVKGFKFHPTVQGLLPSDRMTWPFDEVIAERKCPAVVRSGHSGIGLGMPCGGGLRLLDSNPMLLEDVAIDVPLIRPERWMADFDEAGFKDKVEPLRLKDDAKRLRGRSVNRP